MDLDLRFDGFSKNNIRESSSSDFAATLYRVKTSVIDLRDQNPSTEEEIPELFAWGSRASFFVPEVYATNNMVTSTNSALCIEIVGSDNIRKTFDRIVVRKCLAQKIFACFSWCIYFFTGPPGNSYCSDIHRRFYPITHP